MCSITVYYMYHDGGFDPYCSLLLACVIIREAVSSCESQNTEYFHFPNETDDGILWISSLMVDLTMCAGLDFKKLFPFVS